MISKERLEEMIKHKEIIYAINGPYKYSIPLGISNVNINGNSVEIKDKSSREYLFKLENLIDNKEDFDFLCNYQNITRTETLSLPTFEEFIDKYRTLGENIILDEKCIMFNDKLNVYSLYADDEYIWIGKEMYGEIMFKKPLTKENYLQACEICRKLFLGEEDE